MKIIITLVLLFNVSFVSGKESKDYYSFIKKNIDINKKYKVNDSPEIFKKIILGDWLFSPRQKIIFFKNGRFKLENYKFSDVKELEITGTWMIKDNKVILIKTGNKRFVYEVDHYRLRYNPKFAHKYNLTIIFKERIFDVVSGLEKGFN